MQTSFTGSRRVMVRKGFTEEDIWRDTLGRKESLFVFVTYGSLDAPDAWPGGSMRQDLKHGPFPSWEHRPD